MNLLEDNLGIGSFFIGIFLLGTLTLLCGKARDPGGGGGKERRRRTQSRAAPQTKDIKKRIQNERAELERSRKEGEEQSADVGTGTGGSHASEQSQSGVGSEKETNQSDLQTPAPKPPSEKEVQMISERVPTKDEKAPSRDDKEGQSQSGTSAPATSAAATSGAQPQPADTVKASTPAKDGQKKEEKESDSEESDEESVKKSKKKKKKKHSKKKSKKRSKKKSSKKEKKREKKTYFDQSKDNNSLDKPEKIVYPQVLVPAKKQKTSRTVEKGLTTKINDLLMTENNEQQLEEAETQMMSGQTNAPNPSESSKVMQLDKTQALSLRSAKVESNPMMKLDQTQNLSETKCLTGIDNNNGYEELPLLSVQAPPGDLENGEDGTPHEETAASTTNKTTAEKASKKVLMATLGPADGSEKKPAKKSPIEPIDPKRGGSLRVESTLKSVQTTQTQQQSELQTGTADGPNGERISMVQETQPTTTKIATKSTMQSFPNSSDVVLGIEATQPSKTRDAQAVLAPKVFPKGAKAERISKFGLRHGAAEYPTGSDIKSDWTPTSGSGAVQNAEEVDLRRSPVAKNDPGVPRVIPKSAKAEKIARYGLHRGGAEYPTFGDIRSDWTSTEGAAAPSKLKNGKESDYTKFENDPTKKKKAAALPPAKDPEKKSKKEAPAKQPKREKDASEKKKASPLPESSPLPPPPAQEIDPKLQEEERIKKLRAAAPKPKKFKRTPYEEKIAQGIIVRKKQDYPTMGDVISDWDSENSSTSQLDHHQHQKGGAAKTPKKAKDSDKQH